MSVCICPSSCLCVAIHLLCLPTCIVVKSNQFCGLVKWMSCIQSTEVKCSHFVVVDSMGLCLWVHLHLVRVHVGVCCLHLQRLNILYDFTLKPKQSRYKQVNKTTKYIIEIHLSYSTCFPVQVGSAKVKIVDTNLDAIQLSIFSHRFMSIAEQMGR